MEKEPLNGLNFRYAYKLKTGELIFAQELPEKTEEIAESIEVGKISRALIGFDYNILIQGNDLEQIRKLSEVLSKNKFSIPYIYGEQLINSGNINSFLEHSDFRFFRSEMPHINDRLAQLPEEERLDFFKFANALGCFSTEKMLDKNGKETQTILAQKATTLIGELLKTEGMKLGKYHGLFDSLPIDTKPSQEFLKFLSLQGEKKSLPNLEMIIALERNFPGMFVKVMTNFNKAKSYRSTLDEHGKPISISWEEALKKFYLSNKYNGVTKENEDIAELFGGKGLSQQLFDKATSLRQKARRQEVPEHILQKPIREESILESIERIKAQTEVELTNGRQMIEELYEKQFTYEWLSKNDPHNSIMGLFCSCCGTITSQSYGKDIARASVIAPDVQNLVIRNSKGEIISKGTMYVNKAQGYAVINDFELNEQYRHHEDSSGRYNVAPDSKEEAQRQMIFEAFKRGLRAFVKEYDAQNPNSPMKQINVGMGYNRLKTQVEEFKKATSKLTVPAEYSFQDAASEQYILYQRPQKQVVNGGDGR